MSKLIPVERIQDKIYFIRGHKVMIDKDLAELYKVETGALNRQVKRNSDRFPPEFMFQLTKHEFNNLKCHFGISSWGGTRKLPCAFTEHGVLMLSSVLNSKRAIQVNIQIMKAFIELRELLITQETFKKRIDNMEQKYDKQFRVVFQAIKQLLKSPKKKTRKIGF